VFAVSFNSVLSATLLTLSVRVALLFHRTDCIVRLSVCLCIATEILLLFVLFLDSIIT